MLRLALSRSLNFALPLLCCAALSAQTPAGDGGLQNKKDPPTPEQQREQRIRDADLTASHTDESTAAKPTGLEIQRAPVKPLAGSVAASSHRQKTDGPEVESEEDQSASDTYTGPAVLSRSYTLNRPSAPQSIRWTPTLSASSLYESGLTGSQVRSDGSLANISSPGARFGWGLNGQHNWKHNKVLLDYRGDLNRYSNASAYNGSNHNLNLDVEHDFTRRISLKISENASSYSQSYTLSNPALGTEGSIANVNLGASPVLQILDNGFKQSTTQATMVWQKSARLSFSAGGGYFGVVRNGQNLVGNTGYTSMADVSYRYTRKTTVGAYYAYTDYVFSHRVQMANTHTVGLIYSYAFTRSLELRARFGGTRLESEGLMSVAIDPAIAALLGQQNGIVEAYSRRRVSDISAEIAKDFGRRNTAKISYARGISPGNGLQLTSLQESISGGFTSTLFHKNKLDIGGGRSSLNSAAQSVGAYSSNYVSVGVTHQYARGIAQDFRAYYRTFDITNAMLNHPQISLSMGFSWSPGENPIHF